jgi:molybdopterin-guanine dinucleotide biosynthesis protein A
VTLLKPTENQNFARSVGLAPLFGLVMAGGKSRRMGENKALLSYASRPQIQVCRDLLHGFTSRVLVSARKEQRAEYAPFVGSPELEIIEDRFGDIGPAGGILSAMAAFPQAALLVVAVDLPMLAANDLQVLVSARDGKRHATAFLSRTGDFLEPLCTIYEPHAQSQIVDAVERNVRCLSRILGGMDVASVIQPNSSAALTNINSRQEFEAFKDSTSTGSGSVRVKVRYFASLREQAGRTEEVVADAPINAAALYDRLRRRYGFLLDLNELRVAVNGSFADMNVQLAVDDEVVFIPPVAGG